MNFRELSTVRPTLYGVLTLLTGFILSETSLHAKTAQFSSSGLLKLSDFLKQVETGNQDLQSSRTLMEGALLQSVKGSLILSPSLFANLSYSDDKRQTMAPVYQGQQTIFQSYSVGVQQTTRFGLGAKLSYVLSRTQIVGASPEIVTQSDFYETRPVLELSQALWKNGFGRDVQAQQEIQEAQALATSFGEGFRVKSTLAEAEIAYWNLALARENVRVQEGTLSRAEKMRVLYQRRSNDGLSDRADLLQSEASVSSGRLSLQNAKDSERAASRALNTLRGLDGETIDETLEPIDSSSISNLKAPERAGLREDVRAAQQQERVSVASASLDRESTKPAFDLVASLSTNGRDPLLGEAASRSLTTQYPWSSVGLRMSVPLDFGSLSKLKEGTILAQKSAELRLERALYEQEREWNDLGKSLAEGKVRLELARAVEATQREKLNYERTRLTRGRTTTFQVLAFEQDYSIAQLSLIQAQSTILQTIAKMKTFGDQKS